MDALPSSFLSAIPTHKISFSPTKSLSSCYSPLHISSARTENGPLGSTSSVPPPPRPITTYANASSTVTSTQGPKETKTSTPPLITPNANISTTTTNTKRPKETKTSAPSPTPPPSISRSPPKQAPEPWLPATILNSFDNMINTFIDPPTQPSVDPRFFLSNNFAPVNELPPTECRVIAGSLPPCLDGAYIRNGPNPQFLPRGPYHLFDGDGMLHCLRISGGGTSATLSSRYVQTYKFTTERQVGTSVIPNVFSGFNGLPALVARGALTVARVVAGQFNLLNGAGLANTSLALIGGKPYAIGESDLPYEIRVTADGDVVTLDRQDFGGKLIISMTAHPKLDPETGEVFAFRYGPVPPFLTFFRFDQAGNKLDDVPIFSMNRPSFLHDFAITKKYAIFPDIQVGMDPTELIIRGGPPVGADPGKVPRIGVIPRYARDEREMRWFEVPGFNIVHAINAWDEVDEHGNESITLIAPNILSIEHVLKRMELIHASVERVKIDLASGTVSRTPLSASNLDFGVLNPAYVGKKNRFAYAAVGDPMPKITGVVKLDLETEGKGDSVVARRMYGEECYGGEPFFVAREPNKRVADEDDGYLVSYVHNERKGESRFVVMDTKSPELEVVAEVALPQRVPYGFHGLFVSEKDLS